MSYQGTIATVSRFLEKIEKPKILEIGVDMGQSTIPLISEDCISFPDRPNPQTLPLPLPRFQDPHPRSVKHNEFEADEILNM